MCSIQLQKDLEEVKGLLKKVSRKRLHDVLIAEKDKIEKEIKNQPPLKIKAEKPPTTGYTVKINNYGRISFTYGLCIIMLKRIV